MSAVARMEEPVTSGSSEAGYSGGVYAQQGGEDYDVPLVYKETGDLNFNAIIIHKINVISIINVVLLQLF